MLSGEPHVSVSVLREAVREELRYTSSHAVGREVGLTGPAVRNFVNGSTPHDANIRKYTMWYIRYRARTAGGTLDVETAASAIALLLEHVPAGEREEVRANFLDWVEQRSKEAGVEVPEWVEELRGGDS